MFVGVVFYFTVKKMGGRVQKSAFFIHVCVCCSTVVAGVNAKGLESMESAEIPLKYKSANITYDVEKMNLVEAEDFLKLLDPSNDVCWIYCFCTSEKCFTFSCSHLVEITTKILHGNNEKFYVIGEVAGAGSVFTTCETFPLNLSNSSGKSTVNNTLFAVAQCYTNFRSITEEHFTFLTHDERTKFHSFGRSKPFALTHRTSCRVIDDGITIANANAVVVPEKNGKLDYPVVPSGENVRKSSLDLQETNVFFNWFSCLVGYLQPDIFPTDLVKEALKEDLSLRLVIFQILRIEGAVLAWFFLWLVLAFSFPCAIITKVCCENANMKRLENGSSIFSIDSKDDCGRYIVTIFYHILLALFFAFVSLVLASNEKISRTIMRAPQETVHLLDDVENFIKDTEMQYSFVISSSWEVTTTSIFEHLSDVDYFLGKPLQDKLDEETQVRRSIANLSTLLSGSVEVTNRVKELVMECNTAKTIRVELQSELSNFLKELNNIIRKCTREDQSLCDTLVLNKLEVVFDTDEILSDARLKHLQALGEESNFKRKVEGLRQSFESIPKRVRLDTTAYRSEIANVLRRRKSMAYKSTQDLEDLSKSLQKKIDTAATYATEVAETVARKDVWRWLTVIVLSIVLCLIWCLYVCGAPCGYGTSRRTVILLTCGLTLSCLLSLFLWVAGSLLFLLGGHGRTMICHTLYDEQQYETLGDILDAGGLFYKRKGFFNSFLENEKDEIHAGDVLRSCQKNETAYVTFSLKDLINIDKVANYNRWPDLTSYLRNISVDLSRMDFFPSSLEQHLQELQMASTANLTRYRAKSFGPVTNKDLNSFVDQLVSVSRQISDATTIESLQTLTFSLKRIISADLEPLRKMQDGILFKLTELEVLLAPLKISVNKSLSDLRNVEAFVKSRGSIISEQTSKTYIDTLEDYLQQLHDNIRTNIMEKNGKCGPLWDRYDAVRITLCQSIIAPLNTLSMSCYFLILIFILFSPIILKVISYCKKDLDEINGSVSYRQRGSSYAMSEHRTWGSPARSRSRGSPEEVTSVPVQQTLWASPRESDMVPRPPRPPSAPKMDSPDTVRLEIPAQPRVKRSPGGKSPRARYDSLRQVEPTSSRLSHLTFEVVQ